MSLSLLRAAVRLHRFGAAGYTLTLAVIAATQAAAFDKLAGSTPAAREAFGRSMEALARQSTYLLPIPHSPGTASGYIGWRAFGTMPLIVGIWALAAATGAARGDEDRGLVDAWLAAGVSRARMVAARVLAFSLVAALPPAAAAAAALAVERSAGALDPGRTVAQAAEVWLFAVCTFAICFAVAQLPSGLRQAQLAAGAVVVFCYLLAAGARTSAAAEGPAWISPFRWFERTDVMAPGGSVDAAGTALLVIGAVAGAFAAAALFARRDVHGPLLSVHRREAAGGRPDRPASGALRVPVVRLLARHRWVVLGWAAAGALTSAYMVGLAGTLVETLRGSPALLALIGGGDHPERSFIALYWTGFTLLVISGLAVQLVSTWAADDGGGVLVATLATPTSRMAVVAERMGAATAALALVTASGAAVAAVAAAAAGYPLDMPRLLLAAALMVPMGLAFAAAGALAAGVWPRASVGVLGLLVFFSVLDQQVGPVLGWPRQVVDASPLALYGHPLSEGVYGTGLLVTAAIVVAGFALGAAALARRDVG